MSSSLFSLISINTDSKVGSLRVFFASAIILLSIPSTSIFRYEGIGNFHLKHNSSKVVENIPWDTLFEIIFKVLWSK